MSRASIRTVAGVALPILPDIKVGGRIVAAVTLDAPALVGGTAHRPGIIAAIEPPRARIPEAAIIISIARIAVMIPVAVVIGIIMPGPVAIPMSWPVVAAMVMPRPWPVDAFAAGPGKNDV